VQQEKNNSAHTPTHASFYCYFVTAFIKHIKDTSSAKANFYNLSQI